MDSKHEKRPCVSASDIPNLGKFSLFSFLMVGTYYLLLETERYKNLLIKPSECSLVLDDSVISLFSTIKKVNGALDIQSDFGSTARFDTYRY